MDLRTLFDRALSDEPPTPGNLAREAMTGGRRLRRRRHLIAGSGALAVVAGVATAVTMSLSPTQTAPPEQRTAISLAMEAACADVRFPTDSAVVFLRLDVTDHQRAAVDQALRSDSRIRTVQYRSKQETYAKFAETYRNAPDLVNAVRVEQIPEGFDVRLALPLPSDPAAFIAEIERLPGVEAVSGAGCPETAASASGDTE